MTATLACRDERRRRADVRNHAELNGIDFVEVDPADRRRIVVRFLKPVPGSGSDDDYGLHAAPRRVRLSGGTRITRIRVQQVDRTSDGALVVTVERPGDFSAYELHVDSDRLDPLLRSASVSFMAGCAAGVDCRSPAPAPEEARPEPALDYLAKDYASFRRLLLDLLSRLIPGAEMAGPADLTTTLVELLAHAGDELSYLQDAVAAEAYVDTARHRISARRHARLVDYAMHDGRNAWTLVHLRVRGPLPLPQATPVLVAVTKPLLGEGAPPAPGLDAGALGEPGATPQDVVLDVLGLDPAETVVFETTHPANLDPACNELALHTWGGDECELPAGATEAHVYVPGPPPTRPPLAAGDRLLLEEVKGRRTGAPADADPGRRAVVRLVEVEETTDPVYLLPLLRVRWDAAEALPFALCLSMRSAGGDVVRDVTVARGNVVLADHGLTIDREDVVLATPVPPDERFRLTLRRGPLTMQCAPFEPVYDDITGRLANARDTLDCDVRSAQPAVALLVDSATGRDLWTVVPDLLDSPPFAREFVAEVDDGGRATLRFGDGEYGREPAGATALRAVYRVGNGAAGNVGAGALAHVVLAGPAGLVAAVRNPLAARGGVEPESVEEVRQRAPAVLHREQLRALTAADYAAAAAALGELRGATAELRWAGSRLVAVVTVDPADAAGLESLPDGRTRLAPALEQRVRAHLARHRLAGHDLELRAPRFVAIELAIELCVAPGHFRAGVMRAVRDRLRALFGARGLGFGRPVHVSRVYAALAEVEGVDSALITRLRRLGEPDRGELDAGVLSVGPDQIVRLADDPSFPEHGVLTLAARGGRG